MTQGIEARVEAAPVGTTRVLAARAGSPSTALWIGVAGVTARRGRVPAPPADGVAAARGRDARALRRPRLAPRRRRARHARPGRRAAPLPRRVGRRPPRIRPRRPAARVRRASRSRACRSSRCSAARLAGAGSRARRDGALRRRAGCSSSTGSTAGCTASSCSARSRARSPCSSARARRCGVDGRSGCSTALLAGRDPPLRRARCSAARRRTSSSSRRAPAPGARSLAGASCSCSGSRSGSPTSSSPTASTSASAAAARSSAGRAAVARYLWRSAGDASAGWWPVTLAVARAAAAGVVLLRREARALVLCLVGVHRWRRSCSRGSAARRRRSPGTSSSWLRSSRSRSATSLVRVGRRAPACSPWSLVVALVVGRGRVGLAPDGAALRVGAGRAPGRARGGRGLARRRRASPDDVLFGYEPLYLGAWERNRSFPTTVVPRADARLALRTLERAGRARARRLGPRRERAEQHPAAARDRVPAADARGGLRGARLRAVPRDPDAPSRVLTPEAFLYYAARALLVGQQLGIGDADINLQTVVRAAARAPRLRAFSALALEQLAVARRALERAEPRLHRTSLRRRRARRSPPRPRRRRRGRRGRTTACARLRRAAQPRAARRRPAMRRS